MPRTTIATLSEQYPAATFEREGRAIVATLDGVTYTGTVAEVAAALPPIPEADASPTVDGMTEPEAHAAIVGAGFDSLTATRVTTYLFTGRAMVPGSIAEGGLRRHEGSFEPTLSNISTVRAVLSPHADHEGRQAAILAMLADAGLLSAPIAPYPFTPRTRGRSTTPHPLTTDQIQVLTVLSQGYSDAEAGPILYRSPATVKSHVGYISRALGVHSRAEAILVAVREGYIPVPTPAEAEAEVDA